MSDPFAVHPEEIVVEGQAGDVFLFNGHGWHAGRRMRQINAACVILIHYVRADYPARLNYREAISPEVQAQLRPIERQILGLE